MDTMVIMDNVDKNLKKVEGFWLNVERRGGKSQINPSLSSEQVSVLRAVKKRGGMDSSPDPLLADAKLRPCNCVAFGDKRD